MLQVPHLFHFQHEACNHGYVAIVELLLDHGAFINVPGCDNDTPLHDAVQNYRHDVVSLLVSRGADCNAKYVISYGVLLHQSDDE